MFLHRGGDGRDSDDCNKTESVPSNSGKDEGKEVEKEDANARNVSSVSTLRSMIVKTVQPSRSKPLAARVNPNEPVHAAPNAAGGEREQVFAALVQARASAAQATRGLLRATSGQVSGQCANKKVAGGASENANLAQPQPTQLLQPELREAWNKSASELPSPPLEGVGGGGGGSTRRAIILTDFDNRDHQITYQATHLAMNALAMTSSNDFYKCLREGVPYKNKSYVAYEDDKKVGNGKGISAAANSPAAAEKLTVAGKVEMAASAAATTSTVAMEKAAAVTAKMQTATAEENGSGSARGTLAKIAAGAALVSPEAADTGGGNLAGIHRGNALGTAAAAAAVVVGSVSNGATTVGGTVSIKGSSAESGLGMDEEKEEDVGDEMDDIEGMSFLSGATVMHSPLTEATDAADVDSGNGNGNAGTVVIKNNDGSDGDGDDGEHRKGNQGSTTSFANMYARRAEMPRELVRGRGRRIRGTSRGRGRGGRRPRGRMMPVVRDEDQLFIKVGESGDTFDMEASTTPHAKCDEEREGATSPLSLVAKALAAKNGSYYNNPSLNQDEQIAIAKCHHEKRLLNRSDQVTLCHECFQPVETGTVATKRALGKHRLNAEQAPTRIVHGLFCQRCKADSCRMCGNGQEVNETFLCGGCKHAFHPRCVGLNAKPNPYWCCWYCDKDPTVQQRKGIGMGTDPNSHRAKRPALSSADRARAENLAAQRAAGLALAATALHRSNSKILAASVGAGAVSAAGARADAAATAGGGGSVKQQFEDGGVAVSAALGRGVPVYYTGPIIAVPVEPAAGTLQLRKKQLTFTKRAHAAAFFGVDSGTIGRYLGLRRELKGTGYFLKRYVRLS